MRRHAPAGVVALAAAAVLALASPAFAQAAPDALSGLGQVLEQAGAANGGAGQSLGRNAVVLFVALTVLSLAPGLAVMVTCFPFIVTVLSILRQSIGLPQSPPNILIVALSLMLTWFVMDPVLRAAWEQGGQPLQNGEIGVTEAFERAVQPFRGFMAARTDADTYGALLEVAPPTLTALATAADVGAPASTGAAGGADGTGADSPEAAGPAPGSPLAVLVPAFMLSEVQRAFEVGFLVALPFLIIDLVVSAVLMSMGMMMVPPAIVSLPFKLAFFVVVDGWGMIAGALVRSYT